MNLSRNQIFAGVLSLVAIVSVVNTQAILDISKKLSVNLNNQTSLLASVSKINDPLNGVTPQVEPQGLIQTWFFSDGSCTIADINSDGSANWYADGFTSSSIDGDFCQIGDALVGDEGGDTSLPSIPTGYPNNTISFSVIDNKLRISASSEIIDAQFKLRMFGYLSSSDDVLTGKLDVATQTALKNFQVANNISPTGTYDPKTKAVLNTKILGVKGSPLTGAVFNLNPCEPVYNPQTNQFESPPGCPPLEVKK